MAKSLVLDGKSLSLSAIHAFAHVTPEEAPRVSLTPGARSKIKKSHEYVQSLASSKQAIYGVNTGFGLLSDIKISSDQLQQLQVNLLRSHACGVGNALSIAESRAALLLRANTLCQGHSGCSLELLDALIAIMNAGIAPWIPEQGSVGACGDLAPLAHMALVLIGEGKAYYQGKLLDGAAALKTAGMQPHILQAKEGLALINGTQIMTAIGALVLEESTRLVKIADIAAAMSLEAVKGTSRAFHPAIHKLRPHLEQGQVAENMRKLLAKSAIAESHKDCGKVQDPYSFRCVPQVHGASRRLLNNAVLVLETEANSVTDNPLVFLAEDLTDKDELMSGGDIISGGNFHGEYVAMMMDTVAIALSEIANISDLRIQKLINPSMSGLPAFLTPEPGVNSGMMIVQVAAASLVSENKILSHPASVDSIPTSADKEDHVSMGTTASRKARQILMNVKNVLAMEILCAAQGLDFHKPLRAGIGVQAALEAVRKKIKFASQDRAFHIDIEKIREMIDDNSILVATEEKVQLI